MVSRFSTSRMQSRKFLAAICVVAIYLAFGLYKLGWRDVDGNEAAYGVAALNILSDHRQLAVLSEQPMGVPGSKPFLYAASLAGCFSLFGKNEFALRSVSLVALLGAGLLLFSAVDTYFDDQWLSILALFFFLLNPWTITYARFAMPETVLVFWGSFALFAAVRFSKTMNLLWAVVCGLGLGLAFLTKLWLVLPFGLACLVIFAAMFAEAPKRVVAVGASLAAFVAILASTSHLLLVLWQAPEVFRHWLYLYFIESFSSRITGEGHDPAAWFHPWWFYLAGLFKASFFGLPAVYLAVGDMVRSDKRHLLALLAAMLSPFLILSLFAAKVTAYAFPSFSAVAVLLAYGALLLFRSRFGKGLVPAAVFSMATALIFFAVGTITAKELGLITALYLLYVIAALSPAGYKVVAGVTVTGAALAAMLIADVAAVRTSRGHRTYYRELAAYFRPSLAGYAPQAVVFQAPEPDALAFYLFRSGQSWHTYDWQRYVPEAQRYYEDSDEEFVKKLKKGTLAFYVVDPTGKLLYASKVSPETLNALHQYAVNVTPQVETAIGRSIPLEVFVPRVRNSLRP
jgi:4-amino-4-deoxy-L-arabinose transferase-like glycosyltransferase